MEHRTSVDTLITHGSILTMQSREAIVYDGALAIDKGLIVAVDTTATILKKYHAQHVINADSQWVLPGFVNGHTHMGMTLLRASADHAQSVHQWLHYYIFEFERELLAEDFVYWSSMLACYEMIQSGITTVADMYFMQDITAQVVEIAGIRALLGETIFRQTDIKRAEQVWENMRRFSRSTFGLAPHSVYGCTQATLRVCAEYAHAHNLPVQMHVAEHANEVKKLRVKQGCSPIEYLEKLDLLNQKLLISHGVHVSERDIKKIAQARAAVIYNPTSNMKLGSGIAPVAAYKQAGVPIGLGTDGAASNNSLNMIAEMKTGQLLQQLFPGKKQTLMAYDLVHAATQGGAQALGLDHEIGSLEAGKHADIIIMRNSELSQLPYYDPYGQIVYATYQDAVQTVMARGKLLMHDRQMLTLSAYRQDVYAAVVRFRHEILLLHKNSLLNKRARSR